MMPMNRERESMPLPARKKKPPTKPPELDDATLSSDLLADLQRIEALPAAAQDALWEVVEPNLAKKLDDRVEVTVTRFCRTHQVSPDDLAPCIRALRFLLCHGAHLALPPERFAEDLARRAAPALVDRVIAPLYARAFSQLRRRLVVTSLAEHGKLVMGVDWRLDTVRASQDGQRIDAEVAQVTFRYQEGAESRRVTLQLLPEMVEDLLRACAEMLER